jgi:hypothetical protein
MMFPPRPRRRWLAAVAAPLLSFAPTPAAAQDTLAVVLQRASVYATQYRRQMSSLVAEETYVQDFRPAMGATTTIDGKGTLPVSHRELKSDFLMVRPGDRYIEFRDVFEVDGTPVRDRQERLTTLFLSAKDNSAQVQAIAQEGARFNIGNVFRNFNTPTLALIILEPEQQARFRFRRVDPKQRPALARNVEFAEGAGEDLWIVEYRETQPGTLIRRLGGGDMPATGRFWINGGTGRVLASELVVGDPLVQGTIDVFYGGQLGGLAVPAEMRERYVNNRDRAVTTGVATYGRVRRFGVTATEDIPPIGPSRNRPGSTDPH